MTLVLTLPPPTPCDPFGPAPDFNSPTESAFKNGMILGQNDAGNAAWQHTHKRVHFMFGNAALPLGYDVYSISDTGAASFVTLWPVPDLCGQNELWIKNNTQFPLTINATGNNTFDFSGSPSTLVLPGVTGNTGNTGGASVHLISAPGTVRWLIVAAYKM